MALLPTDSIFLCMGQVVVQTEKKYGLILIMWMAFLIPCFYYHQTSHTLLYLPQAILLSCPLLVRGPMVA